MLTAAPGACAEVVNGCVTIEGPALSPGVRTGIGGKWLYKPGYALSADERPESPASPEAGYAAVTVPQMLSRIRWWLDDSEGFKAFEDQRLAALGFDTERAEDGWYRLWIDLGQRAIGDRRMFIEFDGMAMRCRAYLNGSLLGEHTGMFGRFAFDLTPYLRPGRNLLAVYVSMEKLDPQIVSLGEAVTVNLTMSKILSLSKGMFGPLTPVNDNRAYDLHGIWQPVALVVRGGGRIDDAWFIPGLDSARVEAEVCAVGEPGEAFLRASWTDIASGGLLHKTEKVPVRLARDRQVVVLTAPGLRPKLWSPEEPNLYLMEVTLEDGAGQVIDVRRHRVGFRTFEVRGNMLYLNDRPYWLRGANQLPYGKNPWDPELARKLIRLAHDGNTPITRTHCTPWNEAWLDAADEIGLGVSIEGVRPWALVGKVPPPPREMVEHWKQENEDVIRRCRNHPSVLIWTVGNEMTLRDDANISKWEILSELVRQTKTLDPTRPVVCSSGYHRDRRFHEGELQPRGLDDGDMDDLHSYRGWYAVSPFVEDTSWIEKTCDYAGKRPIIGQEMSTGYPNLDDGLPVTNYATRLMVPQAWVGSDGEPGGDPAAFLEHQRAVTKRLAEQLRFQRKDLSAGFMLFSSECWFANSYDPERVSPYPVYEAVRQAFAPVGLAVETPNRRFFAGESVDTAVFITNDHKDLRGPLALTAEFVFPDGAQIVAGRAEAPSLEYYATIRVPVSLSIPPGDGRRKCTLRLRLTRGGDEISRTDDPVELFDRSWSEIPLKWLARDSVLAVGVGANVAALLDRAPRGSVTAADAVPDSAPHRVILVWAAGGEMDRWMPALRRFAEAGRTIILLGAGKRGQGLFPECIARSRELAGEFVDISRSPAGLKDGLEDFDCKWWGRGDGRAFVVSAAHNLVSGSPARPLASHVVVHGYIDEAKKADYITSPLVEIPLDGGRFILSEFEFEGSAAHDPVAVRFLASSLAWSAKPPAE